MVSKDQIFLRSLLAAGLEESCCLVHDLADETSTTPEQYVENMGDDAYFTLRLDFAIRSAVCYGDDGKERLLIYEAKKSEKNMRALRELYERAYGVQLRS